MHGGYRQEADPTGPAECPQHCHPLKLLPNGTETPEDCAAQEADTLVTRKHNGITKARLAQKGEDDEEDGGVKFTPLDVDDACLMPKEGHHQDFHKGYASNWSKPKTKMAKPNASWVEGQSETLPIATKGLHLQC